MMFMRSQHTPHPLGKRERDQSATRITGYYAGVTSKVRVNLIHQAPTMTHRHSVLSLRLGKEGKPRLGRSQSLTAESRSDHTPCDRPATLPFPLFLQEAGDYFRCLVPRDPRMVSPSLSFSQGGKNSGPSRLKRHGN